MNGDISRIPIQSLSAVVSLTDIIPELPLPTPLHSGSSAETLLYDPSHSLHFSHAELVGYLSEALGNVCTNNISLKKLPVFEQKRGFYGLSSQESYHQVNTVTNAYKVQPSSWGSSLDQPLSSETHLYPNSFEEPSGSPNKKKKKRKKKKHKHYEDGDTSGGESNATTPAACGGTTPNKFDDNCLSPASTYGVVKVNDDTKKLSLKIFKRPTNDGSQCVFMVEQVGGAEPVKKEKKKKRNKEKDRDHRLHHEISKSPAERHVQQTTPSSVDMTVKAHSTPTTNSPTSTPAADDGCKISESTPSTFIHDCHSKDSSQLDLSLMTSDGLFDNLNSMNNLYQQPQSQSTSSLPSTPASISGNGRALTSSGCAPFTCTYSISETTQASAFTCKSNMFYELLRNNDPTMALKHLADNVPNDLFIPSSSSAPNALGSVCNMMDFASNFLQNEMLSSNSSYNQFPLGINSLANCDSSTVPRITFPSQPSTTNASSFLVQSNLIDSSQSSTVVAADSTFDVLGGILNNSCYTPVTDVCPATFAANFDMPGLPPDSSTHHVPMGIASYLSAPTQTVTSIQNQNDSRIQSRKRRKNELEDLQSWTVNYPVSGPGMSKSVAERTKGPDERTWDDAIGSYSQVLGERAKKRKRMVKQGGNLDPDYVFEHDKDYPNDGDSDHGSSEPSGTLDLTIDSVGTNETTHNTREMRSGAANRSYAGMDDDDEEVLT
ncbi:unnamed protein product, partial [Trichobilharzia regenti]